MRTEGLITTAKAAARLSVSQRRVIALIKGGRLPSVQIGREHLIREDDLKLVAERRPGRPPKAERARPVSEAWKARK